MRRDRPDVLCGDPVGRLTTETDSSPALTGKLGALALLASWANAQPLHKIES
jgi:hypothetical protein